MWNCFQCTFHTGIKITTNFINSYKNVRIYPQALELHITFVLLVSISVSTLVCCVCILYSIHEQQLVTQTLTFQHNCYQDTLAITSEWDGDIRSCCYHHNHKMPENLYTLIQI